MRAATVSLVLGPLGSMIATFFWVDGRYGVTGGTILVLAMVVWAHGLVGLLQAVRPQLPRLSAAGLPVVLFGVMGGMAFGFQGFFEGAFGLTSQESLAAMAEHPVAANVLLWLPGPVMPLSLLALGAALGWRRIVPAWLAGLLCLGAVAFPLSRIPRIAPIAYVADALLVIAFAGLAWQLRHLLAAPIAAPGPAPAPAGVARR